MMAALTRPRPMTPSGPCVGPRWAAR